MDTLLPVVSLSVDQDVKFIIKSKFFYKASVLHKCKPIVLLLEPNYN